MKPSNPSIILTQLARIIGVLFVLAFFRLTSVDAEPRVFQGTGPFKIFLPAVNQNVTDNGPSVYTTSYYMATVDSSVLFNRGCALGTRDLNLPGAQDNIVILDFGGPRKSSTSGLYGARLFTTAAFASTAQIANAAQQFALGYYNCTGDDHSSTLVVGIGTNNYVWPGCVDDDTCSIYHVTYDHGRAWANMVNQLNQFFVTNGYSSQVSAVGANDIELSWNHYEPTKAWLDGYDSVNQYEMINFGAIPGCPYFASPGAQCGSYPYIWSKEQVWMVIWGSPPVLPLPEIYANNGVNAQQWYLMSVYSYVQHGLPLEFRGVMTQFLACQVRADSGCNILDNTPLEGWSQLSGLVNGDARTAHRIRWSTDITW